jgi:hypothetical protein
VFVLPGLHGAKQPLGPELAPGRIGEPRGRWLLTRGAANGTRQVLVERDGQTSDRHTAILLATSAPSNQHDLRPALRAENLCALDPSRLHDRFGKVEDFGVSRYQESTAHASRTTERIGLDFPEVLGFQIAYGVAGGHPSRVSRTLRRRAFGVIGF